jgi:hypothetical protein
MAVAFTIGLVNKNTALAATTPSLGAATSFGVLSSTYTNTTAGTTINGDLGFTTPPAVAPTLNGTQFVSAAANQAGTDQGAALSALASQACTFTFPDGAVDLATETTHGTIGVYEPGVYCTTATSAASIGTAGITLTGGGTYIFRINGALTSAPNAVVTLAGGASACNVFWTPTEATTFAANSVIVGTVIDASGITMGNASTLLGRALAFGGTVTTTNDTITVPSTCAVAPVVVPTPVVTPIVAETDSDIKVEKTASDYKLNSGPKKVTFKYEVTNEGTVALSDVSLKDDKCDEVDFKGGDENDNDLLDLTEEWKYECTKKINETETNTATAKGHANGEEVKDTDKVTVEVSTPTLPAAGFAPSTFWGSIITFFSF